MKAIILGNQRGVRRLSAEKSYPHALNEVGNSGRTILDWSLGAFEEFGVERVVYIGGYHIEKVVKNYSNLHFYYHDKWKSGHDIDALYDARAEFNDDLIIVTSDIVFRKAALDAVRACGNNAAIGTVSPSAFPAGKNDRFDILSNGSDKMFAGMIYIPSEKIPKFSAIIERAAKTKRLRTLQDIAIELLDSDRQRNEISVDGHWAALVDSASLAQFILGTKGQTLERFRPMVHRSKILPHTRFSKQVWRKDPQTAFDFIAKECGSGPLIVRSSSTQEDSWISSNAGNFHSELNVDGNNKAAIKAAIEKVFSSYANGDAHSDKDEVLVQPYLEDVAVSGVLFTRDSTTSAPYYVVNFDRSSRRTDTVTSGTGEEIETFVMARDSNLASSEKWQHDLIDAVKEVESLLAYDALDIEWAIDSAGDIYLLQVRPLVVRLTDAVADDDFNAEIEKTYEFIKAIQRPSPYLAGNTTLLGEMPDWNPVEMIGGSPKPLALSLYQCLITDSAWAKARTLGGYRDARPLPLLYALSGKPFIDVRASFNSLLPANLPEEIAEAIINGAIEHLTTHPEFHDKVEFEVIPNCYHSGLPDQLRGPVGGQLSVEQRKEAVKYFQKFTGELINKAPELIDQQLAAFETLSERREKFSDHQDINSNVLAIRGLVADCIRYGTVPFSILARYGFIAIALLRDLVASNIFSSDEYEEFLQNIPTIATQISSDLKALQSGVLNKHSFLSLYGHLRPGSYDIDAQTYGEMVEAGVFDISEKCGSNIGIAGSLDRAAALWESKAKDIESYLENNRLNFSTQTFFQFVTKSIPGRELGKFEFTKNLSLILDRMTMFGSALGISKDEIAFTPIDSVLKLSSSSHHSVLREELLRAINYEKKRHRITQAVRFPALIANPEDVFCYGIREARPNFVTHKKAEGNPLVLDGDGYALDLSGRIVVMEAADPGCDWIFSHKIAGLVTKYGGSASHMAIRSAEFDVPSAIGCGEIIFNRVSKASYIVLDCENQTIHVEN